MLKNILISSLLLLSFLSYADTLFADTLFADKAFADTSQTDASIKQLQIGSILPPLELKTQHGKSVKIGKDVNTLLFAVEKAPSALINNFILKQEAGYLKENKAYFVADISGMPSLITKMFAIPKMKKRPYDILLAKKSATVAFIPRKKEFVTVVKVAAGKVTAIMFLNKIEQLAGTLR